MSYSSPSTPSAPPISSASSSSAAPVQPYIIKEVIDDEDRREFNSDLVISLVTSMIAYVIATYPYPGINGDSELSYEGYVFLIAAVADIPRHFSDLVEDSDWFG